MKKNNYLAVIDHGSSKLRLGVFSNKFDYLYSSSKDILDNNNQNEFSQLINFLIKDAEKKISNHINDVILLHDEAKIFSIDLSLKKKFDQKSLLDENFSSIILEAIQLIKNNYSNKKIIHLVKKKIFIDGEEYKKKIKNDLYLNEIIVDLKFISMPKNSYNKIINNFKENGLIISNFFCSSYTKSFSYIKSFVENQSVAFLDIGWEKSSLNYFVNNQLNYVNNIPIGGNHITKDISNVLKIDTKEAEKIKTAFNESEFEFSYEKNINNEKNNLIKKIIGENISIDLLKKVVLARIEEIIELVFNDASVLDSLNKSENSILVLTGNGSKLFNKNFFHLDDKYNFREINFYQESDLEICKAGINFENYWKENEYLMKKNQKKIGFFESFFNFFNR